MSGHEGIARIHDPQVRARTIEGPISAGAEA
jgi:hypothetical protein